MVERTEPARAGHLSFTEFVRMMCKRPLDKTTEALLWRLNTFREWFDLFDVDGNRILPLSEFTEFMDSTGFKMGQADLREVDQDGNGCAPLG